MMAALQSSDPEYDDLQANDNASYHEQTGAQIKNKNGNSSDACESECVVEKNGNGSDDGMIGIKEKEMRSRKRKMETTHKIHHHKRRKISATEHTSMISIGTELLIPDFAVDCNGNELNSYELHKVKRIDEDGCMMTHHYEEIDATNNDDYFVVDTKCTVCEKGQLAGSRWPAHEPKWAQYYVGSILSINVKDGVSQYNVSFMDGNCVVTKVMAVRRSAQHQPSPDPSQAQQQQDRPQQQQQAAQQHQRSTAMNVDDRQQQQPIQPQQQQRTAQQQQHQTNTASDEREIVADESVALLLEAARFVDRSDDRSVL
eukprot:96648_1